MSDLEPVPFQTRTENFLLSAVTGYSMLSGNLFLATKVYLSFDQFSQLLFEEQNSAFFAQWSNQIVLSPGSNAIASTLFGAMAADSDNLRAT